MGTGMVNDTDPDASAARRVPTDPGLGGARKTTDPGLAPPSSPIEPILPSRTGPSGIGSASDAPTPVLPLKKSDVITEEERHAPTPLAFHAMTPSPLVARARPATLEPTPVPPEATDALLTGLIEAENESYFRKAKPAAQSSGEAAVAFAAGPRAVAPGNPTPPPDPPVLLRRSVEMDIVKGSERPELRVQTPPEVSSADRRRMADPTEVSLDVKRERPRWVERWAAFVLAAAVVGILGIFVARSLRRSAADDAAGVPSVVEPSVTTAPVSPPSRSVLPVVVPPPPPATAEPQPAPLPKPSQRSPAALHATPPAHALPPPLPIPSSGVSDPPPKDDVKRAM